ARTQLTRVHTFDAEHANVALLQAGDEVSDGGFTELHRRQIEDDRPAGEKARRAGQRCIQFLEPADDRHDRRKHERDVGPAAKAYQLTWWLGLCTHDYRLAVPDDNSLRIGR